MDKRVILAVAGSGKTTYIINQLDLEKRSLLITYTDANFRNLRNKIVSKFGFFPENIRLYTYFTFLYSFCYRPFLSMKIKAKGIDFDNYPPRYLKKSQLRYYLTKTKRLYHNRIANFLESQNVLGDVNTNIENYFDSLFVDEVQDFGGHDFNLLKSLIKTNVDMIFVGDFFQHTFDTSRDGNTNSGLYNDFEKYLRTLKALGLEDDCESLEKSYRCSPTVCDFISEYLGIRIFSHRKTKCIVKLVETLDEAEKIFSDMNVVKLFYSEHYKYMCHSNNWGNCKGEDCYSDVCVVLNKTSWKAFKEKKIDQLNPQTKNKLYVACSRPHRNLYFASYNLFQKNQI